jgi:uncharacterized protein (DUF697 family)
MSTNDEVLAGLRIIGAVARADGKITKEERTLFTQAVAELTPELPDGTLVEDLLTKESDLEADLAAVKTPAIRRAVFEVSYFMSASDGAVKEEGDLLKRIRQAYEDTTGKSAIADMLVHNARQLSVEPTLDPSERAARVTGVIDRRGLRAGIIGAIPLPFFTDVGVLLQVSAVIDEVALVWGQPLTKQEKWAAFGALLAIAGAQGAMHSLIKMIPGWGTVAGAVTGAVGSYVLVGAIGRAVNYHFEKDGKTTPAELRKVFHEQKAEAKKSYEADKERIAEAQTKHAKALEELATKADKGEITREEYDQQVEALLE